MAVSKRLRFEILRRDNFRCNYCGATSDETELHVDHLVPVALGGTDDAHNLVTACADCNSGKSSTNLDSTHVDQVQERLSLADAALAQAIENRQAKRTQYRKQISKLERYWENNARFGKNDFERATVRQFLKAGLGQDELLEAMDIAFEYDSVPWRAKWRYFCGISRNWIKEIEAEARTIMEGDTDG